MKNFFCPRNVCPFVFTLLLLVNGVPFLSFCQPSDPPPPFRPITLTQSPDDIHCPGDVVTLYATTVGAVGYWVWFTGGCDTIANPGSQIVDPVDNPLLGIPELHWAIDVRPTVTTTYHVRPNDGLGCAEITIVVNATGSKSWYQDLDGDLFGNPDISLQNCSQPVGYVDNNQDCNDNDALVHTTFPFYVDADHDGFGAKDSAFVCAVDGLTPPPGYSLNKTDIDDHNPAIHNYCLFYLDADGDGFGASAVEMACDNPNIPPPGYTLAYGDCNDGDPNSHTLFEFYVDADHDGYGTGNLMQLCVPSPTPIYGYSLNNTDCDDSDPDKYLEAMFYLDSDHDGYGYGNLLQICTNDTLVAPPGYSINNTDLNDEDPNDHNSYPFFVDIDGDGFGYGYPVMLQAENANQAPQGYSVNGTDCDDQDAAVFKTHPFYRDNDGDGDGAGDPVEICRSDSVHAPQGFSITNTDCDDSDPLKKLLWAFFPDADHDGYGAPNYLYFCTTGPADAPPGFVTNGDDCNDADPSMHARYWFYEDEDGDGFGSTDSVKLCAVDQLTAPPGYSIYKTDCYDNNPAMHQKFIFYLDDDGDGFGASTPLQICAVNATTPPVPYLVTNPDDCNDADNTMHARFQFFVDQDHDGIGSGSTEMVCAKNALTPPLGFSLASTDCDDADSTRRMICQFYFDSDKDGFGSTSWNMVCARDAATPPKGYSLNNTDCDDLDTNMHERFPFYYDNDLDSVGAGNTLHWVCARNDSTPPPYYSILNTDCDDQNFGLRGNFIFYVDSDQDGFGGLSTEVRCALDSKTAPLGYSTNNRDCNDTDPTIHPGATELDNGRDDDCDGQIDEIFPSDMQISAVIHHTMGLFSQNGSINLTVKGLTGPYTYLWENNSTTEDRIGLSEGTYSVVVTDQNSTIRTLHFYVGTEISVVSPPKPGLIKYPSRICAGSPMTFSINRVPYASLYHWTFPVGVVVLEGQGDTLIQVLFPGQIDIGSISVTASNSIGISVVQTSGVQVERAPAAINAITGPLTVCGGLTQTYSVKTIYRPVWFVTGDATYTISANKCTLTVHFPNYYYTQVVIKVWDQTSCGNHGPARSITVKRPVDRTPGLISGSTAVCSGTLGKVYKIAKVTGAVSYKWTCSAGTFASAQGLDSIVLDFPFSYSSLTLGVQAVNICGTTGAMRTLTIKPPVAIPGTISGSLKVCAGSTGNRYSIAPVAGATSYKWATSDGTITTRDDSTGVSINFPAVYSSVVISVQAFNSCGGSAERTLTITPPSTLTPGTISGNLRVCQGTTGVVYKIAPVAGASAYNWIASGATLASPQGPDSIIVDFPASHATSYIRVQALNVCGIPGTLKSATITLPVTLTPGAITGNGRICGNSSGNIYSIAPVAGATSYNWVASVGTIASGQGSDSISLDVPPGFTSSVVKVQALNSCGNPGSFKTLTVSLPSTPTPGSVSGNLKVCGGTTGSAYSIVPIAGTTSYNWVASAGTITTGQGSESILFDFPAYYTSLTLKVQAFNACGTPGAFKTITITPPVATPPATVKGPLFNVCNGSDSIGYRALPVTGAVLYDWTISAGTIISGQGTDTIAVNFPVSYSSAVLKVRTLNACGTFSPYKTMTITPKPAPPVSISGSGGVCPNTVYHYTLNEIHSPYGYSWSVPTGWTIFGSSTSTELTVKSGLAGTFGSIKVSANNNACNAGPSAARTMSVNVISCVAGRIAMEEQTGSEPDYAPDEEIGTSILLFPNPCLGDEINLELNGLGGHISITDLSGRQMQAPQELMPGKTVINTKSLANGVYIIHYGNEAISKTEKLVIER